MTEGLNVQQELEFQLSQITLRAIGFGDPNKPMILALHGWLDNAASFEPIAEHLSGNYLLAIDLAGHGLSEHRSHDAHYHLVDFVYDLHELVISQNWSSFILMGHSMGGTIASLYASSFKDRVQKLISIESLGPMTKNADSSPEQLQESINSRLKMQAKVAKPLKSIEDTIKARALIGELSFESARLLILRNTHQLHGQWFINSDKRLRTLSSLRMTDEQAEGFMKSINCPVLIVSADQGYELVQDAVRQRLSWLKSVKHISCAGKHHLHMDNAEVVSQQVLNFLI